LRRRQKGQRAPSVRRPKRELAPPPPYARGSARGGKRLWRPRAKITLCRSPDAINPGGCGGQSPLHLRVFFFFFFFFFFFDVE
jgi:hypothetical protein